ncbi:DUF2190 family protein [Paracoccus yeei]|uniref:DUF2190 family protein n=1 Tax=Paracoccus yeei TaxID=147645 RepID=UPI00048F9A33|nr:DUF2190 family protein [Paracoccus yeei]OWJ97147.1 hypothetical protein CDV54_04555 [Paracoccus yeei]
MARNHVQPGLVLSIPAPAAVLSGGVVVAGNLVGIAQGDAAAGETVDVALTGVWEIPKTAADSFAVGDRVFWNASTGLATSTVGSNARVGTAAEAAAASTGAVRVRLVQL